MLSTGTKYLLYQLYQVVSDNETIVEEQRQ